MSSQSTLEIGFVLLLVGGVLIAVSGVGWLVFAPWAFGWMGMMGMMGNASAFTPMGPLGYLMGVWGIAMGVLILVAAVRIRSEPHRASSWAVVATIAGALSLFGMGGYFLGAVTTIVGGAMIVMQTSGSPQRRPPPRVG